MDTYHVYILQSQKHHRFYAGMTADLENRLNAHNLGLNKSTRNGTPWIRIWTNGPLSKIEALALERKIKKRGIQRFLEDLDFFRPHF